MRSQMCIGLHVNRILMIFLDKFSKNARIINVIWIHTEGTEFFHADGQTDKQADMMKLLVAFRNMRTSLKSAPG